MSSRHGWRLLRRAPARGRRQRLPGAGHGGPSRLAAWHAHGGLSPGGARAPARFPRGGPLHARTALGTGVTEVRWERYPLVQADPLARGWLQIQADLGLAANTIEAYGRALQDYLSFSSRLAVVPATAGRAHVAAYVRELTTRPSPRGSSVRVLDSGAGLANATLQQRL